MFGGQISSGEVEKVKIRERRLTQRIFSRNSSLQKPGAGIGWTEPRNEAAMGLFDIRKHLKGYIGGVKKRDTMFADV